MNTDEAKKKKVKRPGSGRTKGSFSFVRVPLEEAIKHFGGNKKSVLKFLKDEGVNLDAPITVGRVWAEAVGLPVATTTNANELYTSIEGLTPNTAIKAKVQEL